MSLRIAVLYKDNRAYVEYTPEQFLELLKRYLGAGMNIEESFAAIERDIKKELLTR